MLVVVVFELQIIILEEIVVIKFDNIVELHHGFLGVEEIQVVVDGVAAVDLEHCIIIIAAAVAWACEMAAGVILVAVDSGVQVVVG